MSFKDESKAVEELWCVHFHASDVRVPAENELAALRWANEYNRKSAEGVMYRNSHSRPPLMVAEIWPYGRENHAEKFKQRGIFLIDGVAHYSDRRFIGLGTEPPEKE